MTSTFQDRLSINCKLAFPKPKADRCCRVNTTRPYSLHSFDPSPKAYGVQATASACKLLDMQHASQATDARILKFPSQHMDV
ncbi:unnamed protein product [Ceratitis capitata]|uniref:(Mediterranean fruit fly) hypothetical protein n=1 Tax=Ceratitis capitata TaxID=7213 RepID=A0A811V661_CERCA|nr:unnamed protein product [Ceratitis capitata]